MLGELWGDAPFVGEKGEIDEELIWDLFGDDESKGLINKEDDEEEEDKEEDNDWGLD